MGHTMTISNLKETLLNPTVIIAFLATIIPGAYALNVFPKMSPWLSFGILFIECAYIIFLCIKEMEEEISAFDSAVTFLSLIFMVVITLALIIFHLKYPHTTAGVGAILSMLLCYSEAKE